MCADMQARRPWNVRRPDAGRTRYVHTRMCGHVHSQAYGCVCRDVYGHACINARHLFVDDVFVIIIYYNNNYNY